MTPRIWVVVQDDYSFDVFTWHFTTREKAEAFRAAAIADGQEHIQDIEEHTLDPVYGEVQQ